MFVLSRYFPAILILFHIIGLFLFTQSNSASDLTWMNLLLCGTLVFLDEGLSKRAFLVAIIIFLGGFLIELIGTKTGFLFGDYSYGTVLGWRFFGVSVIIGVNWYALVLASANISRLLKLPIFFQSVLAGILCVLLDFIIEPVAIKFGFWTWHAGEIPIYNYITWFFFATIFSFIYLKNSQSLNKTAVWLYGVWFFFFIVLLFI